MQNGERFLGVQGIHDIFEVVHVLQVDPLYSPGSAKSAIRCLLKPLIYELLLTMPFPVANFRERAISFVASVILCTCIASSVSLLARESISGKTSVRALSDGNESIYGESLSSIFAPKPVVKSGGSDELLANNERAEGTQPSTVRTGELRAQAKSAVDAKAEEGNGTDFSAFSDSNLLTHSIALIGLTVVGVTITALVGFTVLSNRGRGSDHVVIPAAMTGKGSYIELDIDGRPPKPTQSTSLGTEDAASL